MTYDYIMDEEERRYPTQSVLSGGYKIDYELPSEYRDYYVFEIRETNGMVKHTQVLKRDQAFRVNNDLAIRATKGSIFGYSLAYKSNDLEVITRERDLLIADYRLINMDAEKMERSEKFKEKTRKIFKYSLIAILIYVIFV